MRSSRKLGHPEQKLPPVIHVAGTNGKGSTVAYLRHIMAAAGLKVHAYTSPHLVKFHERMRVAGELISEADLTALLEECEAVNGGEPITFFEITTAAAFLAFSRTPADYLILEVGLGGRLDATNVIAHPALSIITTIDYDHQQYLGDTLTLIAGEKAGILKRGSPPSSVRSQMRRAPRSSAWVSGCGLKCTSQARTGRPMSSMAGWCSRTRMACSTCRCRSSGAATRSTMPATPSPPSAASTIRASRTAYR